jgi:hypothetical protein
VVHKVKRTVAGTNAAPPAMRRPVDAKIRTRRADDQKLSGAHRSTPQSSRLAHQCTELPHQVGPNDPFGVVALLLQGGEEFLGGSASARSGELKGSFEWGDFRRRHRAFLRQSPHRLRQRDTRGFVPGEDSNEMSERRDHCEGIA